MTPSVRRAAGAKAAAKEEEVIEPGIEQGAVVR